MQKIKRPRIFCCLIFLIGLAAPRAIAGDVQNPGDVADNFSDVLIYIAPAYAIGMTVGARDTRGRWQFANSTFLGMGIVTGLKYSIETKRPNGDTQSFPSGHTAICSISAEFVRRRYGWKYGWPLYAVSAWVGYDRVRTDDHYIHDVLAGTFIGIGAAHFLTKPNFEWRMLPIFTSEKTEIQFIRTF